MWARCCVVAVVAACYSPKPSPGAPCGPNGECPQDLRCTNGLCLGSDVDPDAPSPDDGPLPDSGPVRWAIVATAGSQGVNTTINPTGSGNTLLVGVETGAAAGATSVTDEKNNQYALVQGSRSVNLDEDFGVEVWIAQNSNGGAKAVSAAGPTIHAVVIWEVTGISTLEPIEAVATVDMQATSTAPTGASIATTEIGQFVLSIAIVANSVSGLTADSDFTNDHTTFGNGWAHLTDNEAPPGTYQPQWIQPTTGTSCASSVVFNVGP